MSSHTYYEKFLQSAARKRAEQEFTEAHLQQMVIDEVLRRYRMGTPAADAIETSIAAVKKVRNTMRRMQRHEEKKSRVQRSAAAAK